MNLFLSLKALLQTLREDVSAIRLGLPLGWLSHLHYQGRLADREGRAAPVRSCLLNVNGRQVHLNLSAVYEGAFKGVFIDREYQCEDSLPSKPHRILDLGANIGMGTLYLHTQFPEAEFFCVEPDERNLSLLKANLEANQVNARIVQTAAGAESGTLNLRYGRDPTCSALESMPIRDLVQCVSVTVTPVEALLQQAGWDSVDLVKMDIEGVEDEVLSRCNSWLGRAQALILEIHPNTTPELIASYIRPFGFTLRRVGDTKEPVYLAVRSQAGA